MNQQPVAKRAAIYARISRNPRQEDEKIDRQLNRCLGIASLHEYELVHDVHVSPTAHFVDDDVSAYEGKTVRPAWNRLLAAIENDEIDIVVTWNNDRMMRTVAEMLDFIKTANPEKSTLRGDWATIHAFQGGGLDLATPQGRMVAVILTSVAQYEVEHKSARQRDRNEDARKAGKPLGGPVPFGWKAITDAKGKTVGWAEDEFEANLIRQAIEDRINRPDEVSLTQIADRWTAAGARTRRKEKNAGGNPWAFNAVRKVLVRPANAGLVSKNITNAKGRRTEKKEILWDIDATWPAICTVEQWQAITEQTVARERGGRSPQTYLTGLLTCEKCGAVLMANRSNGRELYRCQGKSCGLQVTRDPVDQVVRQAVRDRLAFGDVSELAPPSHLLDRAKKLREERRGEQQHLADNLALWKKRLMPTADYESEHQATTLNIELIDQKLAKIEEENAFAGMLVDVIEPDRENWSPNTPADEVARTRGSLSRAAAVGRRYESLSYDHRRAIARALFPTMTVSPGRARPEDRISLFTPSGALYVQSDDAEG